MEDYTLLLEDAQFSQQVYFMDCQFRRPKNKPKEDDDVVLVAVVPAKKLKQQDIRKWMAKRNHKINPLD